jgi:hypothetical protein
VTERASAGTECRAQSWPVTFAADRLDRCGSGLVGDGRRPDADSDAAEDGGPGAAWTPAACGGIAAAVGR